jgi:hypothetical protein
MTEKRQRHRVKMEQTATGQDTLRAGEDTLRAGEATVRIGEVDTERHTLAGGESLERTSLARRATLLLWTPVLLVVGLLDGVLGRAGGLAMTVILAVAGYAGALILPPYLTYHAFKDEVAEIGRTPTYDDARIRSLVYDAIHRRKLDAYVLADGFQVTREGSQRRITGTYRVPIRFLRQTRDLVFRIDIDQWVALPE